MGFQKSRVRSEFIVEDGDGWNTQEIAGQHLSARSVRNGQIGPLLDHKRHQPHRPNQCSQNLQCSMSAPVTADHGARDIVKLKKLADLIRVPCGEYYVETFLLKFFDDGQEKWHVRRIIQVNPDPLSNPTLRDPFST